MEIIILSLAVLIYLVSIFGSFKFIQYAHYNINGRFSIIKPNYSDIIMIFIPFLNSILSFLFVIGFWKKEAKEKTNKFFEPKNKL